ncbi:MAG: ABC transporter permease [Ruminococcus sp.]|nr:ABC transporter permease [Ruminococcus sp.]MBP1565516.1 ABC transporter permease subunit [Oscillospiraceae bacterium]
MFALFKKEVQSYFYSPLAYVISALFVLIYSLSFITWITSLEKLNLQFSFAAIFYDQFFYFIFLIPMLTMKTFAEERRANTEVLLMSTPLNVFKIVMGKFLAIGLVFFMIMALTFLYPLITTMYGEVRWGSLICGYLGFFLWGMGCVAVGMLVSSFTENQIIAAIFGEAAMLLLFFMDGFSQIQWMQNKPVLSSLLSAVSPKVRFEGFATGVFRLSDMVFYILFITVFLAWTMISVEKRRWNRG